MTVKRTAGSKFNPKHWPIYFSAANFDRLSPAEPVLQNMLVAVNEIHDLENAVIKRFIDNDKSVLIDSGVYWLSTQHALKHGMSMNEALGLAPDKVDNFADLFERYCGVIRAYGARSWGYIEIDQGGRENKIKTRAKLEDLGFAPIPVYHPLNDGWDYFDYLAENYDRICFGNVVMANAEQRRRLLATAWERRRRYPDLWIHALGVTPSELTTAYPMNSCDSSTWIAGIRWGVHRALTANGSASDLPDGFIYNRDYPSDSDRGSRKAALMCGYDSAIMGRIMLDIAKEQIKEVGADIVMRIKDG